MARKLLLKVFIGNYQNGHLKSPKGHQNGPNGLTGCLNQGQLQVSGGQRSVILVTYFEGSLFCAVQCM